MLRFPHTLNDSQLGLMVVVILPLLGGLFWLYNSYRMGRLKWKPKGKANPGLVTMAILVVIIASAVLVAMAR